MTGLQYHSICIRRDIKALLVDGLPHTRGELFAIISSHGGGYQQLQASIQYLKDRGFYVEFDRWHDTYQWVTDHDDTAHATKEALSLRALPELMRRVRAHRGEQLRAVHHRGEDGVPDADYIALLEGSISSLAIAAGLSPSRLLQATHLDASDEVSILAEVP